MRLRLAPQSRVSYHNGMSERERLTDAVAAAVDGTPTSIRALARSAGVPHPSLVNIRQGKMAATPELARAVADALEREGHRMTDLAAEIREVLEELPPPEEETDGHDG